LKDPQFESLTQLCLNFSDGYVIADEAIPKSIESYLKSNKIPGLSYEESLKEDALIQFYTNHILK